MKLLVVRHGIAMDRDDYQSAPSAEAPDAGAKPPVKNDDLRPLTLEGIRKMRKNAKGLVESVDRPSALISSPLTRALQTAEILRDTWEGLEISHSEALRPDAKPAALIRWLKANAQREPVVSEDAAGPIVIVGHEPHLTTLISWLLTGRMDSILELKKGGACLIEFEGEIAKAKGSMTWLATPAFLRGAR